MKDKLKKPWRVQRDGKAHLEIFAGSETSTHTRICEGIAIRICNPENEVEIMTLLSAAPELLDAAKDALTALYGRDEPELKPLFIKLALAIQKATLPAVIESRVEPDTESSAFAED